MFGTLRMARKALRSSLPVTRMVFGVTPANPLWEEHFDLTTYTLKKALDRLAGKDMRILEMGTGHLGILSIYLAKNGVKDVSGVDINPAFVENAKENARVNGVSVKFWLSDMFSQVDATYDLIFSNLPYVPTKYAPYVLGAGNTVRGDITEKIWHGGENGTEPTVRFLAEAPGHLDDNGLLLLGVNNFYLNDETVRGLIDRSQLHLRSMVTSLMNPSKVYVVAKRQ
jgi:release factor glutamine methyltransferase